MNIGASLQQGENQALEFYDSVAVSGSRYSDLNATTLGKYFAQYEVDYAGEEEKSNLLNNVDIMEGEELTVGDLLVFGIYPQKYLKSASISYAHYLGVTPDADLLDKQVIDGPLPDQIDKALITIKHNFKQPSTIQGAKREPLDVGYPDKVFRELIVNAVTHRNYSIAGSRIRILHFSDRIEFISPGRLPNTIRIEKLKYGVSYASNPVILKFLENLRYVDKLGRGLPMVYKQAQSRQKQVLFEEVGEEFRVTLEL